jgi:N-acetylmuramoyl-L-alanine amidase
LPVRDCNSRRNDYGLETIRVENLKTFDPGQCARRLGTALLLLLLPVLPAQARGKSEAWANTQFSTAERLRESLNNVPDAERSRHEYQRVIAVYRRVYYGAPASGKAAPSAFAVAELLAEMGRCFHSESALHSAIGQYKFLRREYPGSHNRFEALFNIAQIYQDDLKDPVHAKPIFEEFLRRYPRNHLANTARQALSEPVQQAVLKSKDEDEDADSDSALPKGHLPKPALSKALSPATENAAIPAPPENHGTSVKFSRVTNVRHWSNPDYTRVAIDLDQDVKFESQRIDHPERIFFDLLDTNLASALVGKTFGVDDGLLKKIRAAQFQPGKARIVLELADRSEFDTFLLTDPPRLIIDIHGRDIHSKNIRKDNSDNTEARDKDDGSDFAAAKEKHGTAKQAVQAASLKEPEPAKIADAGAIPDSEAPASPANAGKKPGSLTREIDSNGPRKTIVEADNGKDDDVVTIAKLDPPEINLRTRTATTLTPSPLPKGSAKNKRKAPEVFPDAREASPTARGDRSLIRALGLKIGKIVIDPGHGGHDTGTIGPNGLEEKDLVLDVGRRLGKLLQARLGADVVFTRKDDTFIPLETRTSIANQEQADLFVSIHANSSRDPDARGVETYYLNFTSSAEALDVAARENAASDKSIHELQDLVKKIALKEKIEESREFASNVQRALHTGLATKNPGIRDRGVKKAPFIVLIGANMPSILAEISFVSNPGDERRLGTPEYRQRIAESLYRGISKYVSGLSGIKVASKIDKGEGQ